MPVKIRLARHGRKKRPFYYIVAADSRAPRDGRYIERIGSYNPNTAPATIDLDFDKALMWLNNGAQPSDTCRAILSYQGVMYKKHLLRGVAKGAITQEQADEKFTAWKKGKDAKIEAEKSSKVSVLQKTKEKMFEAEVAANKVKSEALAKKRAAALAKVQNPDGEETSEENTSEE